MSRPLALFTFAIVVAAPLSFAAGPTKRALIVGINRYLPPEDTSAAREFSPTPLRPIPVNGQSDRSSIRKLSGAVNDAEQMAATLEQRFGFDAANVRILRNEEATADNILSALKSHLIDAAKPGDISFFYYAGHGSRMLNTKSDEPSRMDSTIVPADSLRGVPDIRGKELARIYRHAVEKKITLTVVQDSCFSGSGARGPLYTRLTERVLEPDGRSVADPFTDAKGNRMPFPEDEGVLVLSASQDYQPAAEVTSTDLNGAHGVFTWALLHVLDSVPPDERVDTIFQRVRALVQTLNPGQEPVLAGKGRADRSLLGQPPSSAHVITATALTSTRGVVKLQAGFASGLREGSELKRIARSPLTIRVTKVTSLNSAEATVVKPASADDVKAGDVFQLIRWVVPDEDVLRVYYPDKTPALKDLERTAKALIPLRDTPGIRWIDDPTVVPADHVVSWNGTEWVLTTGQHPDPVSLGLSPTAEKIAALLHQTGSVFVLLPPPREMLPAIRLGEGTPNDAVRRATTTQQVDYVLLGRVSPAGALQFAWALPNLSESDVSARYNAWLASAKKQDSHPPLSVLPLRTDWVDLSSGAGPSQDAGDNLTEKALRLARVRGWLQLQAPPSTDDFPYHLAMKNVQTGAILQEGRTRGGEKYDLILRADPKDLDRVIAATGDVPKRWIYVFVVDSHGSGMLLYPPPARGSIGNRMPVLGPGEERPPADIALTRRGEEIEIAEPFGVDTLYMLASDERIPDPNVLSFEGVRTGGERGAVGVTPLSRLLSGVGAGTRSMHQSGAAPVDWSIERHTFESKR